MAEILWNIDYQRFEEKRDGSLIIGGWAIDPEKREQRFILMNGKDDEIGILSPGRSGREDVLKSLNMDDQELLEAGFEIVIPFAQKLAAENKNLKLVLCCAEEKRVLWEKNEKEIQKIYQDTMLEIQVDTAELQYQSMIYVEGWIYNQSDEEDILSIRGEKGEILEGRITRGRRPDVVESRELSEDYKARNMGFRVWFDASEYYGKSITLRFETPGHLRKTAEIPVMELKKAATKRAKLKKFLSAENREQNIAYFKEKGAMEFFRYAKRFGETVNADYEVWLRSHRAAPKALRRQRKTQFAYMPLISIVIPLYCTPVNYFRELIDSIQKQSYPNWQLCLADGSPDDLLQKYLKRHYRNERRIQYTRLLKNKGISENTNAAVAMALGEYVIFCDHDDVLEPDALFEIVKAINKNHKPDVLYTDEDKVSMDGDQYFEPNMKPDFNLFRLRENNYICHIFAVSKKLMDQVGLLNSEFDGAQDFDFILRCTEKANMVIHIPKVLYHWRCHRNSTAADPASKQYAFDAGKKAVQQHYERLGIRAEVQCHENPGWYRSRLEIVGQPMISIIIPNKDHIQDLEKCVSSIREKSRYRNFEILIVENNSTEEETFAYYKQIQEEDGRIRVLFWKSGFNYAAINNFAAEEAKGEYLLFLNNDIEVITEEWLDEMVSICQQPEVAAVGAKLYYPDDTIQHAGVVIGLGGIAGHIMCRASREEHGYMGRLISVQEITAVTAACMMVKKAVFDAVSGFDEDFAVAFNDIDLCMKIRSEKKKIVFTPYAELYHYESKSRGLEDTPEKQLRFDREVKKFEIKWKEKLLKGDPYYSPNLSKTEGDCSLSES